MTETYEIFLEGASILLGLCRYNNLKGRYKLPSKLGTKTENIKSFHYQMKSNVRNYYSNLSGKVGFQFHFKIESIE